MTKPQMIKVLKQENTKAVNTELARFEKEKRKFWEAFGRKVYGDIGPLIRSDYDTHIKILNVADEGIKDAIKRQMTAEGFHSGFSISVLYSSDSLRAIDSSRHQSKSLSSQLTPTRGSDSNFKSSTQGHKAWLTHIENIEKINQQFAALIGNAQSMKSVELKALLEQIGITLVDAPTQTAMLAPVDIEFIKRVRESNE